MAAVHLAHCLEGNFDKEALQELGEVCALNVHTVVNSVPMDLLDAAKEETIAFLSEYETLYGHQHMSYNSHLLTHIVDCVNQ